MTAENNNNGKLKPVHRRLMIIVAGGLVCLGTLPCWGQTEKIQQGDAATPQDRPPEYTRTRRIPEELLKAQRQGVILPSTPAEAGKEASQGARGVFSEVPAEQYRLPEGYMVTGRQVRVERQGEWLMVHLAKAKGLPDAPPLRVLPNRRLEVLETIAAESGVEPRFMVTGRVMEFQGVNYLLIESLAQVASQPAKDESQAETSGAKPAETPAQAKEGEQASRPTSSREPTAEEVLERLLKNKPLRSVVLPKQVVVADAETDRAEEDKSRAVFGKKKGPRWPEDTLLVDRLGRVAAFESWWMLVFENQGRQPKIEPVRILPNRLLENALALSGGGTRPVVFVISGEVTVYKRTNYLLLRKVLVRRDLGNFR